MIGLHVTVTCHNYNMLRTEIPVDVLRDILDYVDKAGLATMCRVNKICCSYSQDVLYRDIYVKTPNVQQTLAQSTDLARRVRSFETYYESDLAVALRNMASLRNLKLSVAFRMDILDGCTFKLDSFECSYLRNFDKPFRKFLRSQPSLKYVASHFIGYGVPSPLEVTCLPNLTRIGTRFPWLPYVPGRPLNEVISYGYNENEHSIDLGFFALSTTPIQKLTIDYSYLYPTPAHLLASFLHSLTHFTLTVMSRYTFFNGEGVCGLPLY
jgi:hypothetical protein